MTADFESSCIDPDQDSNKGSESEKEIDHDSNEERKKIEVGMNGEKKAASLERNDSDDSEWSVLSDGENQNVDKDQKSPRSLDAVVDDKSPSGSPKMPSSLKGLFDHATNPELPKSAMERKGSADSEWSVLSDGANQNADATPQSPRSPDKDTDKEHPPDSPVKSAGSRSPLPKQRDSPPHSPGGTHSPPPDASLDPDTSNLEVEFLDSDVSPAQSLDTSKGQSVSKIPVPSSPGSQRKHPGTSANGDKGDDTPPLPSAKKMLAALKKSGVGRRGSLEVVRSLGPSSASPRLGKNSPRGSGNQTPTSRGSTPRSGASGAIPTAKDILARMKSKTAAGGKSGPGSPRSGATSPKSGASTPRSGVASPRGGIASPRNGTISPRSGINSPRSGIVSPRSGHSTPRSGRSTPRGVAAEPILEEKEESSPRGTSNDQEEDSKTASHTQKEGTEALQEMSGEMETPNSEPSTPQSPEPEYEGPFSPVRSRNQSPTRSGVILPENLQNFPGILKASAGKQGTSGSGSNTPGSGAGSLRGGATTASSTGSSDTQVTQKHVSPETGSQVQSPQSKSERSSPKIGSKRTSPASSPRSGRASPVSGRSSPGSGHLWRQNSSGSRPGSRLGSRSDSGKGSPQSGSGSPRSSRGSPRSGSPVSRPRSPLSASPRAGSPVGGGSRPRSPLAGPPVSRSGQASPRSRSPTHRGIKVKHSPKHSLDQLTSRRRGSQSGGSTGSVSSTSSKGNDGKIQDGGPDDNQSDGEDLSQLDSIKVSCQSQLTPVNHTDDTCQSQFEVNAFWQFTNHLLLKSHLIALLSITRVIKVTNGSVLGMSHSTHH